MTRFMFALGSALVMSGASLVAQAPAAAASKAWEILTAQERADTRNLLEAVATRGCIRLWRPAPDDPTKMPVDHQPGLAGVYLLTPVASIPISARDLPTYVLTPSGTLNFSQQVGRQVAISGYAQAAPPPPSVQQIESAPPRRPENKPSTNGMPRLTVTTMKRLSESCP